MADDDRAADLGPDEVPPPPKPIGFDGKPIDNRRTKDFEPIHSHFASRWGDNIPYGATGR